MKSDHKKTVLVLLSLYNGEKYIKEQLDSLLNQTMPVFVLARDDGSTDNTTSIIKEYINKYNNIVLIEGENKGFVKSFNELLMNPMVDNFKWIAFCDQDDVWLENKLEKALSKLEVEGDYNLPLMYCSNLTLSDENLAEINFMRKENISFSKKSAMVENIATGCSVVFNQSAAILYRKSIQIEMIAHDYNMFFICMFFGKVIYDSNSYILYRQHYNNLIGGHSKSFIQGFRDVLYDFFNPNEQRRLKWIKAFYSVYLDYLSENDKKIFNTVILYKKNLLCRLRLIFDTGYRGYSFKMTLAFKVRALIGRLY